MQTRILILPALLFMVGAAAAHAGQLQAEREKLRDEYLEELNDLAVRAGSAGNTAAAQAIGAWLPDVGEHQIVVFDVARLSVPDLAGGFAEPFARLREKQAESLFSLARRAAEAGQPSLALRLATEAVRENPDHSEARRVLGYEQVDGDWLTPHESRLQRSGHTWHDTFGWIKERDTEKYEAGLRPRGRQWIPAEQDAALRTSIDRGWVIPTEHFLVTTNHSLEAGVALARRLESLLAVWSQLFADYWMTAGDVQDLFDGRRAAPRRTRPHQVWYFKSRDEYNTALRRDQPRIGITLGIYFDTHRRGYFFAGDDQHPATIIHEAVHQLFQESRPTARLVGRGDNFWIIEGIATYFESFTEHDDPIAGTYFTLGGVDAGRFPTARARVLEENYYVPLAELVRLGKDDLQQRSDLQQIYSQVAGLATFFMHTESGRYRDPLVRYLLAVYTNRADEQTLAELTGQSYEELDREYRRFLALGQ